MSSDGESAIPALVPFVEILWKPDVLDRPDLLRLRDALPGIVSRRLSEIDGDHMVDPDMVDVRVTAVGELDRINPDLYVTILARHEDARRAEQVTLIEAITDDLEAVGVPLNTMIELVLTTRTSVYDYGGR